MKDYEGMVRAKYERDGWTVLQNGAPDFIMVKDVDGKTVVLAVEVKQGRDRLSQSQMAWMDAMQKAGLEYRIERVGPGQYSRERFWGSKPNNKAGTTNDFAKSLADAIQKYLAKLAER